MAKLKMIPIGEVQIRRGFNVRTGKINPNDLEDLVDSIKRNGIQQPLVVNENAELVVGHRRYQAALLVGLKEVPVLFEKFKTIEHQRLANVDENLCRQDLRGIDLDTALAIRYDLYQKIKPKSSLKGRAKSKAVEEDGAEATKTFAKETSEKTGMSERTVQQSVKRIKDSTEDVHKAYSAGELTKRQVDLMIKLPAKEQNKMLKKVIGKSVAETADAVAVALGKPKLEVVPKKDVEVAEQPPEPTKQGDPTPSITLAVRLLGEEFANAFVDGTLEKLSPTDLEIFRSEMRTLLGLVPKVVTFLNQNKQASRA